MSSFQNHAEKTFDWTVAIAMVALNVAVFIQVVSRYVFNSPIDWTEEMARLLFYLDLFHGSLPGAQDEGPYRG